MVARFDASIRICGIALALLVVGACAHKQTIPLDCVPKDVTIYVDKKALDQVPEELELRVDEPHTLYFKREGYEPAMVVLEPKENETGPGLAPADVCVELHFVERSREVQIEVEREE